MHAARPVLLVLALLVCRESAGLAPSAAVPLREGIVFASSEAALDHGLADTQFDFLELRDLWVRVKVRRLSPLVTLKLTFTSPGGTPFYETTLLYTTDPNVRRGTLNGAPASALQTKHTPGGFALDYPVPIAGTVFQRYPKPGSWLVQAQIESTQTSLSTPLDVIYGGP